MDKIYETPDIRKGRTVTPRDGKHEVSPTIGPGH